MRDKVKMSRKGIYYGFFPPTISLLEKKLFWDAIPGGVGGKKTPPLFFGYGKRSPEKRLIISGNKKFRSEEV